VAPWGTTPEGYYFQMLSSLLSHYGYSVETPIKDLPEEMVNIILYGTNDDVEFNYVSRFSKSTRPIPENLKGVVNNLRRRYEESSEFCQGRY